MLRNLAIYRRLLAKYPSFSVVVVVFECGGLTKEDAKKGKASTFGVLLYWEMLPTSKRGYIRGMSVGSDLAGLNFTLREAWKECLRWKD